MLIKSIYVVAIRVYTYIPFDTSLVADLIQVIGGNAWPDLCCSDVQYLPSQAAHLTHGLLSLSIEDVDFRPV